MEAKQDDIPNNYVIKQLLMREEKGNCAIEENNILQLCTKMYKIPALCRKHF